MRPITLTWEKVKAAATKAYMSKGLSAQGPTPSCSYEDFSGRPCAVGAAIPKTRRKGLHGPSTSLLSEGLVSIPEGDQEPIRELQRAHDRWARNRSISTDYERQFAALLGVEVNA